jgi:hypothetical protein
MKKYLLVIGAVLLMFALMGAGVGAYLPLWDTSGTAYVVKSNTSMTDVSSIANKGSGSANLLKTQIGICDGTTTTNTVQKIVRFTGTAADFNRVVSFGTSAFTSASTYDVFIDAAGLTYAVQIVSGSAISVSTHAATSTFKGIAIGY